MIRGASQSLRRAVVATIELFNWWRSEMRAMGHSLLSVLPSRRSPQLVLKVGDASASLEQCVDKTWSTIGTIPLRDDGSWASELPGLAAELRDARTKVELPPREFYFEEFELPTAVTRHLGAALRLQLERRLPVPLDPLLIDHAIVARDRLRETMRVRCAVAHRATVEAWRDRVAEWGLQAVSVGPGGDEAGAGLNLLKRRRDPIRWSPSPLDRKLLRIAAVGAALYLVLVGVQWVRERAVVRAETAELHAQAGKLATQRVALSTRAAPLAALRAIVAAPSAPDLLSTFSAAVPSTAWFNHVEMTAPADGAATLRLIGSSASKDEVVPVLRAVPGVSNVRASSTFNGNFLGRDRVDITAEFRKPASVAP
jgi:hypothetical protein